MPDSFVVISPQQAAQLTRPPLAPPVNQTPAIPGVTYTPPVSYSYETHPAARPQQPSSGESTATPQTNPTEPSGQPSGPTPTQEQVAPTKPATPLPDNSGSIAGKNVGVYSSYGGYDIALNAKGEVSGRSFNPNFQYANPSDVSKAKEKVLEAQSNPPGQAKNLEQILLEAGSVPKRNILNPMNLQEIFQGQNTPKKATPNPPVIEAITGLNPPSKEEKTAYLITNGVLNPPEEYAKQFVSSGVSFLTTSATNLKANILTGFTTTDSEFNKERKSSPRSTPFSLFLFAGPAQILYKGAPVVVPQLLNTVKETISGNPKEAGALTASYLAGRAVGFIPRVSIGEVKFEGETVFRGISVYSGTRAIPVAGSYAPTSDILKLTKLEPQTPVEGAIALQVSKRGALPPSEATRLEAGLESVRQTQYLRYKPASEQVDFKLGSLEQFPKANKALVNAIVEMPDVQVYGSVSQKLNLGSQMVRTPADIDIHVVNPEATTTQLVGVLSKAGAPVRATGTLIEVKIPGAGKEWVHVVDIKPINQPIALGGSESSTLLYGFKTQEPIEIGGVKVMRLSEQAVRKGANSVLVARPSEQTFGPEPHRIKDIADFLLVQKALIARGKTSFDPLQQYRARVGEYFLQKYEGTSKLMELRNKAGAIEGSDRELLYLKSSSKGGSLLRGPPSPTYYASESYLNLNLKGASSYYLPSSPSKAASPYLSKYGLSAYGGFTSYAPRSPSAYNPRALLGNAPPSNPPNYRPPNYKPPNYQPPDYIQPFYAPSYQPPGTPGYKPFDYKPPDYTPLNTRDNRPPYLPPSGYNPFYEKKLQGKRRVRGYLTLIRRYGKFKLVSNKPLPLTQALSLGVEKTKESLAATLRVQGTSRFVEAPDFTKDLRGTLAKEYTRPVPTSKLNAPLTFIQKVGTRLGTRAERLEIKLAKRRKRK